MSGPPPFIVHWAERCAAESPCQKSKRGVVIFSEESVPFQPIVETPRGGLIIGATYYSTPAGSLSTSPSSPGQLPTGTAISPTKLDISSALYPDPRRETIVGHASAMNGPPSPITCDGSSRCRKSCGMRCVHAEMRALSLLELASCRRAFSGLNDDAAFRARCELVHVKIGADGKVIPGGSPSCWQCSRLILEAQIGAVWLFEHSEEFGARGTPSWGADVTEYPTDHPQGSWIRYSAEEFHRETCRNAEVY